MPARRSRRLVFALAALLAAAGLLVAVDRLPSRLICEETWDAPTHVLIDGGDRAFGEAAIRYRRDPTITFLFIGRHPERVARLGIVPTFEEQIAAQLRQQGIPDSAIETIPGDTRTTWDMARQLRRWLQSHPTAKVQVLVGRLASANQRAIFAHELPSSSASQVRVCGLPDRQLQESGWWHHRYTLKCVFNASLCYAFDRVMGPPTAEPYECDPDELAPRLP